MTLVCIPALVLACWFGGHSCSAQPGRIAVGRSLAAVTPAPTGVPREAPRPLDPVAGACRMIYRGQFAAAGEAAQQSGATEKPLGRQLAAIIHQYAELGQQRGAAKQEAFKKQLVELDRLKASGVLERPDHHAALNEDGLAATARDANEPNDLPDVLAVLAKASEFADSRQKKELLSDAFVAKALQTAIDRSVAFEAEGKWLDAYTNYFVWLQAVDPNNRGYTEHTEELLDRAGIAASFQDSPCESRKERYEGVEKRMLEKAVDVLDLHYVRPINYSQMATKALKRCDLLAQVLVTICARDPNLARTNSLTTPDPARVTAWSAALAGLRDEVERAGEGFGKAGLFALLDKVLSLNEATVELPTQALVAHFSEAALAVLDPYTVVVWPQQVQDFEKQMTNQFTGIGIEISRTKGLLTVASLLPDTPAYRSGLDAGDVIEAVDSVPTKDMSLICAVKKITGPKGSRVALTIRRSGEASPRSLTITRDRIIVPTVRGWQRTGDGDWRYLVDEDERIGYVRVTSFSGETANDLETALRNLEDEGLRALILDLRFNTGGLLDSAVAICDKFLSEGLIVRTQPKDNGIPSIEKANRRGTHPNYPLVLLINSGSASASEIVAGALADPAHERAILVGTRTHGKGSVQGITYYPGGGAQLKYTMAYYHLPSGQRVQSRDEVEKEGRKDWGVGPDIEVTLTSEELRQMLETQRSNDVLVQAHRDGSQATVTRKTVEETLQADPQLAVGLLVAKTKLIEANALAATN
ncbi:MAG: S41 family peptidase [Planctomycetes bacterium]|jgi:carboxyl-terminal processing protease|nr:S41 family peptidase [Planctomycetota bacterium]